MKNQEIGMRYNGHPTKKGDLHVVRPSIWAVNAKEYRQYETMEAP